MTVIVPDFDYDGFWRDGDGVKDSTRWKDAGLHWHGYVARLSSADYGNEGARRDLATELPPRELNDWLRKPARAISQTASTPEDMADWLRRQWLAVRDQLGQDVVEIDEERRFGMALYELRLGQVVCWGGWLNKSMVFHLAAVPTAAGCH